MVFQWENLEIMNRKWRIRLQYVFKDGLEDIRLERYQNKKKIKRLLNYNKYRNSKIKKLLVGII